MGGIIIALVLVFWCCIVKKIADFLTTYIQKGRKKTIVYSVFFVLLFIAPFADEIIGGFQFRALCVPGNLLVYNADRVKNKRVKTKESNMKTIKNKLIPIQVLTRKWLDLDTEEVLITHRMYYAQGGWLSRFIGFPSGSPPYTFNGHCDIREYYELFNKLNIVTIENN